MARRGAETMALILFISLVTGGVIHWSHNKHKRELRACDRIVLTGFDRCMDKECLARPETLKEVP